ncbi:MAG: ATP-binding protein [Halobacteriovoraceae bacterium]|nr:ATP-binding protein [Halobacteriovoraceae bacterium]
MIRSYSSEINKYIDQKMILLSGPRQCGKTTLSKMLKKNFEYLNYDYEEDRTTLAEKSWDRRKDLIIFDEIHKKRDWKRWLKGIYDVEGIPPSYLVTGSAKLDTFRKVGDSMAGRYFQYRIHPFDIRELDLFYKDLSREDCLKRLMNIGGFPEPFLDGSETFYHRWKKTHLDIILRQDLLDIQVVQDIRSLELLVELLKDRVGSPISYSSLARDLQRSDKTIKSWLKILEDMYVVFKVIPFHKNIGRSNLKKPKYYFFDIARVDKKGGARFENLVACSLYKECQFRQDCLGQDWNLYYLAKNGGVEIDFAIEHNSKIDMMIEVKSNEDSLSKNFKIFEKDLPSAKKIQLVEHIKREKTYPNGAEIRLAHNWLCDGY